MHKLLAFALAAVAAGATGGIATAQQGAGGRNYPVTGFDKVSSAGPQRVTISVGDAASVRASGPADALALLEVEVEDGGLRIGPRRDERDRGDWREVDWKKLEPVIVHVTVPRLSATSLAGGGRMEVDRVDGDDFRAAVAGSGEIAIGALRVDDAHLSIAGSGGITAQGRAREARVSIAGSGKARTRELTSEAARVSVVGSGDAALTVAGDARVSVMGSGIVDIAGPAHCSVSRMGSGRVTCNGVVHGS